MRLKGILFVMFTLTTILSLAQGNTHTIRLNPTDNALLNGLEGSTTNNYSAYPLYRALTWTHTGRVYSMRSLMRFDLSHIPPHAEITSAVLHLKGMEHYPLNQPNDSRLHLVENEWDEQYVNWENQPLSSSTVYATIPGTASGVVSSDNKDVDLTDIAKMWHAGVHNNGLLFKLINEVHYTRMVFHSGTAEDPNNHPILEISYTLPEEGMVTWDAANSTSTLDIQDYTVSKTKIATGWNCHATSTNKLYQSCEGYIKFNILNNEDNYNIGFSNDLSDDINKYKLGVAVQANGEANSCMIGKLYANNTAYNLGIAVNIMDEIKLGIIKSSNGTFSYEIRINDVPVDLSSYRIPTSCDHANTLHIKTNLYNISCEVTHIAFYTSGRVFYVNDDTRTNDIWCSATGNSQNSGTSPDSPKSSVSEILTSITDLSSNDRILVDAGDYPQTYIPFSNKQYGIDGLPLRIYGVGRGVSRLYGSNKVPIIISNASNIDVRGISLLAEDDENADFPALVVENSNQITIRNCYIQNESCDQEELIQFNGCNDVTFKDNIIVHNTPASDAVAIDDCSNLKFEKNRIDGGNKSLAIYNTFSASADNQNIYINRNFFSNSLAGIYLSFSLKSTDALFINNNSFYNQNACILAELNTNLTGCQLVNNIFETTSSTGYPISIVNFEGEGTSTVFFNHISHSIFYKSSGTDCAKFGTSLMGLEEFLNTISSYTNTTMASESMIWSNPLYLYPNVGNLNVSITSQATNAGVQDLYYLTETDVNGISYAFIPLGGGRAFNSSNTVNYAVLKDKLDASYHLPDHSKLYIKYKEEYSVASNAPLTFNIYNDYHTKVADNTSHPGLITRNPGENYLTVNLCGISGTSYMILELYNAKGEKSYLRFRSPTAWYADDCGLESQNTSYNIQSVLSPTQN